MPRYYKICASKVRDWVRGAGMAFDPIPCAPKREFARTDVEAFALDYKALLSDWMEVSRRLSTEHQLPSRPSHSERHSRAAERQHA